MHTAAPTPTVVAVVRSKTKVDSSRPHRIIVVRIVSRQIEKTHCISDVMYVMGTQRVQQTRTNERKGRVDDAARINVHDYAGP